MTWVQNGLVKFGGGGWHTKNNILAS